VFASPAIWKTARGLSGRAKKGQVGDNKAKLHRGLLRKAEWLHLVLVVRIQKTMTSTHQQGKYPEDVLYNSCVKRKGLRISKTRRFRKRDELAGGITRPSGGSGRQKNLGARILRRLRERKKKKRAPNDRKKGNSADQAQKESKFTKCKE